MTSRSKIVTTALFGDGDKYAQYLRAWIRGVLNLFPKHEGWLPWVMIDDVAAASKHGQFIARLNDVGLVAVLQLRREPLTRAMLWRMLPVFANPGEADYVFCRDLDSPPMPRDRACCDFFMTTDCVVHTIHDNVAHAGIMGGLCGFRSRAFVDTTGFAKLEDLCAAAKFTDDVWAQHGADQIALNRLLNRSDGPKLLEHRFAGWQGGQPDQAPRRKPGLYICPGASALVPNAGRAWLPGLDPDVVAAADRLGAHLGCAGYDHEAARDFWDRKGNFAIAASVHACERGLW